MKQEPKNKMNPKISIVVTCRNDNHGGNLLFRLQLFVNGLIDQCQRHRLSAELILVEWNPPIDRPRLAEVLSWPEDFGLCSVRIIEVSLEIHNKYKHAAHLPLFQMLAKNVGIRRAKGSFILVSNIDILFSDELVSFLSSSSLSKGLMYRIDRSDVPATVPRGASVEKQLAFCRNNIMRICKKDGIINCQTGAFRGIYSPLPFIHGRTHDLLKRFLPQRLKKLKIFRDHFRLYTERVKLHTNACGDFTLLDKDGWFALRGYPELEIFSLHLDSLFCYCAFHSGAKEMILKKPLRIYHIEHAKGSGWTPEGSKALYQRIDGLGIPRVSNAQFDAWAVQMRREQKPLAFNDDNWGLADLDLPEMLLKGGENTK